MSDDTWSSQGDRIAAGKTTSPGLTTEAEDVPSSLRKGQTSPTYKTAEKLGMKYGDKTTYYGRKTAIKKTQRKGGSK